MTIETQFNNSFFGDVLIFSGSINEVFGLPTMGGIAFSGPLYLFNNGTGIITLQPQVGHTIQGGLSVLAPGQFVALENDAISMWYPLTTNNGGGLFTSNQPIFNNLAIASVTATIATTLTAAELVSAVINRTGPTAIYTDTTDTASNIVAAIPNAQVGTCNKVRILNTVAFAQTLVGGTGVTIVGTAGVSASAFRDYILEVTAIGATPTVTLTNIGSGTL